MKYINTFKNHSSYEEKLNGGVVDISLPNVSYCEDVKDVHYNPYNTVEFYVGNITSPQTVKIYTDSSTSVDVQVSEGNKWYSYAIPKDKGLYNIEGDSVKKVVVKADIVSDNNIIIPSSTVEASFKGSNTSNVVSMESMFEGCSNLTSLDVSSFNTSNVTNMSNMFNVCSGLTSLDVSNFDTSNVTYIYSMFSHCSGLTSLDVSNFDTSNVIYISGMFSDCSGLTSLDLSNFDTSNVTTMNCMFQNCTGLTSLNLSGWDMSNVTDMENMFVLCGKLRTIKMVGCLEPTITKIQNQLKTDGITGVTIVTE